MKVELVEPNQVRITWPAYDAAIEAQILERLKLVPGIEGRGRRWYASPLQVPRLMELFPRASFDYDALRASDGLARAFYAMCVHFDMHLEINASGDVCAVSGNVSPLIEQLIDERAHALRPLVMEAMRNPRPQRQEPQGPWQGPLSAGDARFEPLLKGIQNAKKAAEEQEVRYPKRRRKMAQGKLEL